MKPSEELLEISRRRYERAGIIADWKPDPNCVGSQDILEWLDAQASGATVAERDSLPTYHQRARRSEHYRCPVHGSHVLADAGGECAGCGADCFIEPCCGTMQCTGQPSEPAAPQPESSGGGEDGPDLDDVAENIVDSYGELIPDGSVQALKEDILDALKDARELGAKAEREAWQESTRQARSYHEMQMTELKEKLAAAEATIETLHRIAEFDRAAKAAAERDGWNREANEALDSLRTRAENAEAESARARQLLGTALKRLHDLGESSFDLDRPEPES